MVKEIAILKIDPTDTKEFEKVYKDIAYLIRKQAGYYSDELLHVIENPDEYVLIIQWKDVAAHQKFMESEDFPVLVTKWGYMQKSADVRHSVSVVKSEGLNI